MKKLSFAQRCRGAALLLLSVSLFVSFAGVVRAEEAGSQKPVHESAASDSWAVDQDNPELSKPTAEQISAQPLQTGYFVMDIASLGDKAFKEHRYADALKFYRVLSELVPERAVSYGKLCQSYLGLADRKNALQNCRAAMGKEGATVADAMRFVGILLGSENALVGDERRDAEAVIRHLRERHVDAATVSFLDCQFAVRLDDMVRLASCSKVLDNVAHDDPRTVLYLWTLAARQGNALAANALLVRAASAGVDPAALASMETQTKRLRFAWVTRHWRPLLGAASIMLALAGALLIRRRPTNKPVLSFVARM